MSGLILHFITGVSNYYFRWITSSLFVYFSILAFFAIKILIIDKNNSHLKQDLFGLVGTCIFCVLSALIQGVLLGTVLYFITNNTEMALIKRILYNSILPMFLIGYDYFGKKMSEENYKSMKNYMEN
jgi:cell shape-determining protein MreD